MRAREQNSVQLLGRRAKDTLEQYWLRLYATMLPLTGYRA